MATSEESAQKKSENGVGPVERSRIKPPPGPPVFIQAFGFTVGIEKKRREAREEWERRYGQGYEATPRAR